MNLYVVYDTVAVESGPVYEAKNDGVAWRNYGALLAKTVDKSDFMLLCVGSIDHVNNVVSALSNPRVVEITVEDEVT